MISLYQSIASCLFPWECPSLYSFMLQRKMSNFLYINLPCSYQSFVFVYNHGVSVDTCCVNGCVDC